MDGLIRENCGLHNSLNRTEEEIQGVYRELNVSCLSLITESFYVNLQFAKVESPRAKKFIMAYGDCIRFSICNAFSSFFSFHLFSIEDVTICLLLIASQVNMKIN
jgi:hypothetical protein